MKAVTPHEVLPALPVFDQNLIGRSPSEDDLWLIGWRCSRCRRLAFGRRAICPVCGFRSGRCSRLEAIGELETWTTVHTKDRGHYTVGYCLVGDGADEQRVRVFGPIAVVDEAELTMGQAVSIRFDHSWIEGREARHHAFYPSVPGTPT